MLYSQTTLIKCTQGIYITGCYGVHIFSRNKYNSSTMTMSSELSNSPKLNACSNTCPKAAKMMTKTTSSHLIVSSQVATFQVSPELFNIDQTRA